MGTQPKFWALDGTEGLEILDEADLEKFLATCAEDGVFPSTLATIRNLEPGVSYLHRDQNEGVQMWTIRRMGDDEVKDAGF